MNLNRESLRQRQVHYNFIPPSNGLPVFGRSDTDYWVKADSGRHRLHNIHIDRVTLKVYLYCFYRHTYPGIKNALCLGGFYEC